jgi:hypothetical protein
MNNAIKRCEGIIIEDKSFKFKKGFQQIYPFTNENISGYIDYFDVQNKNIMTVGSSLDQTLNAILYNCQDITVLDINSYTKFYYYLKMSTILVLTLEEYLNFFCYKDYPRVFKDNKEVFNLEIYNKIKSTLRLLDYESYFFWDELFQTFNPLTIRKKLFSSDECRTSVITDINPYLKNIDNFEKLKKKLTKVDINFINDDLFQVELKKKYDNIWLSNVGCYLSLEELKILIDKVDKYLNENGTLLISYLYDTTIETRYQSDWAPIYNLSETLSKLEEYHPILETFIGVNGIKLNTNINDSVLIYKKTRK